MFWLLSFHPHLYLFWYWSNFTSSDAIWVLLQPHRCQTRYLKACSVLTELFWNSTGHVWWSMRVRRERSMASSDTTISRMMASPLSASRSNSTGVFDANVQNYIYLPANRHIMSPVCVPRPPLHFLTACSSTKSDATCWISAGLSFTEKLS